MLSKAKLKVFSSTSGSQYDGRLFVKLYPELAQMEIWTTSGKICTLEGEDLGKFIAWVKEEGFNL